MKRFALILMFVFGAAFFPRIAYAQDATAETNPVSIVTAEPAAPAIICEDGATCNVNEEPAADNSPVGWIALVLTAIVGVLVSISLGLQVVGNRAKDIASNPAVLATLEQGYDTSLPDIIKTVIGPLKESLERSDEALKNVLLLVEKLTDGIPEVSKPPVSPSASNPNITNIHSAGGGEGIGGDAEFR